MHTARVLFRTFLLSIVFTPLFLFFLFGNAHAQTNYLAPNTNPNVPQNQHTFIQSVVLESLATGICLLSGYDILSPTHRCLGIDPHTQKLGLAPLPTTHDGRLSAGGALGGMSSMIGGLYTHPPVSSVGYVRYMAGKFGFGEKAYAQAGGGGYENLFELRLIWRGFRDVAYGIMVIAFVLIGIAIMLRVRIDPRTVMTVQNQIPKIIIGILLITFSYAIAGFMVDLMWFMTYFGIDAAATSNEKVREEATKNILDNPVAFLNSVFHYTTKDGKEKGGVWDLSRSIGDSLSTIAVYNLLGGPCDISGGGISFDPHWKDFLSPIPVVGFFSGIPLVDVDAPSIKIAGCLDGIFYWIGKYIFTFIVLFALLIALIRLWFTLLKAYAFIILDVIAAPLWIAAGAIPGSSLNFSTWFRHITAHLLLFPAAAALIVIARTIQERFMRPSGGADINTFFAPPLLGNPGASEAFINLIVFAILLMIPELLTILRDALRSKPLPYTGAIGAGAAAGAGFVGGLVGGSAKFGVTAARGTQLQEKSKFGSAVRQVLKV